MGMDANVSYAYVMISNDNWRWDALIVTSFNNDMWKGCWSFFIDNLII